MGFFRFFSSIRMKILLTYMLLVAAVLVLLNTYPLYVSRELIFASKQSTMLSQAALMAKSVGALENLTRESVGQVIGMLKTEGLSRIVVTDASGEMVFEMTESDTGNDEDREDWSIQQALGGFDAFHSVLQGGAFTSCASIPILSNDSISGTVFISEYDEEQGGIILSLQSNITKISLAMSAVTVFLSILFSGTITRRITLVLNAIKSVREGEYNYRVEVKGRDELTQLGEEFNNLTARLQTTEETRRRFVSDASHELKTPLASIKLLSDSILQNAEIDEGTMREFVGDIGTEAERLARTTEKLLSLTRLDNMENTAAVRRLPVDVRLIVIGAVRILRQLAENSSIKIECDLQNGCMVLATDDDIYQVALNLIENAIKYNTFGGTVLVTLSKTFESVILKIEDTGIGIPEDDIPNIFNRFYRVDKARSREAGGSGLGLSIVMSTVKEHGGDVVATRREEGGMRFTVTFPLYTEEGWEDTDY